MSEPPGSQAKRDDAARLLRGAAQRRAVEAEDLFLPERMRLSERERLTARALLGRLVRTIEDELRAALADRFNAHEALHAALASAHVEIAGPAFDGSAALEDAELVSLLLRRSEEHRLFLPAQRNGERLQALIADPDSEIAAHAMAVLVARSRRLDRFQEPILARTELPAELQHRLVWTVAATLRAYMVGAHQIDPAAADLALGQAAAGLIAGYDEGDGLEARCNRLAQLLHGARRLDGAAIADFIAEGTLPLFLAGLSAATGVGYSAVWDLLREPGGRGPVFLLKAAGLSRQEAGSVLLLLAWQPDDDRLIRQIDLFDALRDGEAAQALSLWSLDSAYRDAVLRLDRPRHGL
ncbi:MAG TPA: DUF2336 domain-containing protein [Allosphingosinicella sp.]|uniref:DUF2336 domain-containing protein n=1 Tax=Allosphingosinicella sp. TaxID=2823234 RepID=UPI002F288C12